MIPSAMDFADTGIWLISLNKLKACSIIFCVMITVTRAIFAISKHLRRQQFMKIHGCKPCRSFPIKDKVLGLDFINDNIKAFSHNRFLQLVYDRMVQSGATWHVRTFGYKRSTFTASPENIQTILSLKFEDYKLSGRRGIMSPLLGRGIFTSDDEEWKLSRALLRPHFAKEQVADLTLIELHLGHLLSHFPADGVTIDLRPLFHRFTLDSATHFLFGKSTNTLTAAKKRDMEFAEALRYSLDYMLKLLVMGRLRRFWRADPKFLRSNQICRDYVGAFVDEVMKHKRNDTITCKKDPEEKHSRQKSFLEGLANSTDDVEKIQGDILSLLLAGRDTTASLLCSLFWELSRKPNVWNTLCVEIERLGGQKATYEQLKGLKYARYCINETLRKYPPVPSSAKVARCDTVLPRGGGPDGESPIFIPAGRKVFWSAYAMQRRRDIWADDVDEFRPERWETARPSWAFIPFNGGPRTCIGQEYAITESLYVMVRLVQEFKSVEARDDLPWTENLGLTVHPASVKVGFRRRPQAKNSSQN